MANIKSAQKRIFIAEANRQRNVSWKYSIKTAVKKALEAAKTSDASVNEKLSTVYKLYDKAVSKGILHKNPAARTNSRLTRNLNKLSAGN